jgi:hypothetical protein
MSAQLDPQEAPELDDLQVRVVQLDQLGAARKQPRPEPASVATHPSSAARPATPRAQPQPTPQPTPQPPRPPRPPVSAPKPAVGVPMPPPRTGEPAAQAPDPRQQLRVITAGRVFFVAVAVALYLGWHLPTERYITPKRGLGYALGIIGGSLMLLLLVYSLRKRFSWLSFLGPTPSWFRFHMVLGVLGPLCILYHANFSTGATNSNVALFCMLIVATSGLVGRYIYAHIHHGLYGRKLRLTELQAGAEGLRALSGKISFLPELVNRIEAAEQRLLSCGPTGALLGFLKPMSAALVAAGLRWRLHRYLRRSLRALARKSSVVTAERKRLRVVACAYVDRRLAASRRVAGFEGYERLFSLWHALHIPLIFMMVIAAVIHVIAVHVY